MAPTAACEALKVCRLLLHATAGSKTHGLAFRHLKMYAAKNMAPCTVWQPRLHSFPTPFHLLIQSIHHALRAGS
jgi:hypothetical protein